MREREMKRRHLAAGVLIATSLTVLMFGCVTAAPPTPTVLEDVSYEELADKDAMQANDNRLVRVTVQYLGPDVSVMPQQALFTDIADLIMVNHAPVGFDYNERVVSSTESFLVGLPGTDEYSDLVGEELEVGETLTLTGTTKYVNAGFGTFQHLLLEVEELERQ